MTDHPERVTRREPTLHGPTLVARLRLGDESALRALVDSMWRPLVHYATFLLDDADTACDVVQESLAHVWLARDHLAIRSSFEAYLYRSVHNRALDVRRRTTRRLRLLERWWLRPTTPVEMDAAPAERLPLILERALASLPERRRHVFLLAHLHDLTYNQIAEVLNLSPQTVANHVSRALSDLRRQLAPHAAELVTSDDGVLREDYPATSAG